MKNPIVTLSLFCLLIILASSCEETGEGCLDLLANNYDFEAVNPCDSCCTYPNGRFGFQLEYDTLDFNLKDTFLLVNGDSVYLEEFKLVLSDFTFIGNSGEYTIRDTIINIDSELRDDYIYFESPGTYTIGTTRFEDTLSQIVFDIGIDSAYIWQFMPFDNIDQDSNLDLALDSMYNDQIGKFKFCELSIHQVKDSSFVIVELPGSTLGTQIFNVNKPVYAGSVWVIQCHLDLKKLFMNVDLSTDPIVFQKTIKQNFLNAFYLE